MKRQNFIIILVFVIVVFGFYLISCNSDDEQLEENIITGESDYVCVTVLGDVYREGEYRVPYNWTLDDLFKYVGVKDSADLSKFDLLTYVYDGAVYVVGSIYTSNINYSNKININTASKDELMRVAGIGEVIANRIITYRQKKSFKSIEDIKNVSGIGNAVYEKIKNFITV